MRITATAAAAHLTCGNTDLKQFRGSPSREGTSTLARGRTPETGDAVLNRARWAGAGRGNLPARSGYSGAFAKVAALRNSMPVKVSFPSTHASWPGGMV